MLDTLNVGHGAVALGIGMLVGLERERKKRGDEEQAAAGLRTFAITALLGYISMRLGGPMLVGISSLGLVLLLYLQWRNAPAATPDVTGQIALLLVLALGASSVAEPELAAAAGVVSTVLLALRRELHHFVLQQLSEQEMRNGLTLLTVALVVLPLTPDRLLGPYHVLNPRTLCTLVVLLMAVGAMGHIAMRLVGTRYGLPLSAIASGFASGSATIALLAHDARRQRAAVRPIAAAAVLSNLATVTQFALVLSVIDRHLLGPFLPALGLGALVTAAYGLTLLAPWRAISSSPAVSPGAGAFSLWTALIITLALTGIALLSAFLLEHLGHSGASIAAFLSGLGDAHAATASAAALVVAGRLQVTDLQVPGMMALTGNTLSKCVLAFSNGGYDFARYLVPAQLGILAAMWLGMLI